MLKGIREECGLDSPPSKFTTNASETANYILKHKVNYKKNESIFLQKYRELVDEQAQEVQKAIVGRGKYEIRDQYSSWKLPETKWFSMTTDQRKQYLHKFSTALVTGSLDFDEQPANSIGKDSSHSLSVDYVAFAKTSRIPLTCLQGIWNKAAELLATEGAIAPAPGCDAGAKFVLSYRGKKPHLVTPKKSDMFACDSEFPDWKGLGICAHSVAVAELGGKLSDFVGKVVKAKKTPMILKFAEATMPRGRVGGGETS